MARGHQKIQSQAKNQKKQDAMKKGQGTDQKTAALKALVHKCSVCMAQMPDPKTYKQHFESKHPRPLSLPNSWTSSPNSLTERIIRLIMYCFILT
ncbi:hypothetical protein L596_015189 [Steinernema carpocapsae]|uniref:Small EDRK-rich factor-like N-terminal domain-containing protein n=1 Tax=Steinernema carpocapsae TaxID=34508 RepID=A0A4U5NF50_STECR|nr:hypothetical protein L596_015189 [Steinernema carpocapsae]